MFSPRGYNKLGEPSELQGSELSTMQPPLAHQSPPRLPYGAHGLSQRSNYGQPQESGRGQSDPYAFADYDQNVPGGFVPNPLPKPAGYTNNQGFHAQRPSLSSGAASRDYYSGNQASIPGHANSYHANPFQDPHTQTTDPRSPPPPLPPAKDGNQFFTNVTYRGDNDLSPSRSREEKPDNDAPLPWWKRWMRSKWGRRFTSTWVCWTLSLVQIIVFFAELGHYGSLVGKPIETKPFNWMIGPSVYSLINYGARYQPCMRAIPNVQNSTELISWPCPNSTSTEFTCGLSDLCGTIGSKVPTPQPGLGTYDQPQPNQWLRFIIPIFLHVGLIHIGFNLLIQLTVGRAMEMALGHGPFIIIYLLCGIFGFLLGANFAGTNQASMGASGAIFGMLAINILVILYAKPIKWKDIAWLVLDVVVSLILGLIPGVDNFSHIGGILMGFCSGLILLRTPWFCAGAKTRDEMPTTKSSSRKNVGASTPPAAGFREMVSGISSWREKTWKWWAWVGVRAMAFVLALLAMILLLKNFYVWHGTCSWCRHLSCLPWGDYCKRGDLSFITQTTTTVTPNPGSGTNQKRAIENIARGLLMSFTG